MSDELTTIATFASPIEAHLAKNRLEAAGIQAFLSGEETVAMAWHIGAAIGGVKLLVAARDAYKANACLVDPTFSTDPDSDELPPGVKTTDITREPRPAVTSGITLEPGEDEPEEEEEEPEPTAPLVLTDRERDADRALLGALLGLLFFPLQLYVFYLLLRVYFSEQRLRSKYRQLAWVAVAVNVPMMLLLGILFRAWFLD